MKTPYQAAAEYLDESGLDHLDEIDDWGELVSIVASAIEADRAQRAKADVEEGVREFREEQRSLATLHAVQIHDLAERLDEDAANMTDEDQASDLSAACEALHHYAEIIEPYEDDN